MENAIFQVSDSFVVSTQWTAPISRVLQGFFRNKRLENKNGKYWKDTLWPSESEAGPSSDSRKVQMWRAKGLNDCL